MRTTATKRGRRLEVLNGTKVFISHAEPTPGLFFLVVASIDLEARSTGA